MKKFVRQVITLLLIVTAITVSVNAMYVKLYGANIDYTDKFSCIPEMIQICNFGSSHGLCGYNYADYSEEYNCFNFSLTSQRLSYDYRLFQNFEGHITEGTVVFITVSYSSLFGKDEIYEDNFDSKNKRYYSILPAKLLKKYDIKTDVFVRYLPALSVDTGVLVKTLLGKNRVDNTDLNWQKTACDIDVYENAQAAYWRHIENNKYDNNGERIINHEEIGALYNLIFACKDKGAIPILITTPYLHEYTDEVRKSENFYDQFYSIISQVTSDTGVEYYDYGFDERFSNNYEWFMNADHLNKEGARNFVDIIMAEIVKENGYY